MGQKVSPVGFRVGIEKPWVSNWAKKGHDFSAYLIKDLKIRKAIETNEVVKAALLSRVEISRAHTSETTTTNIYIHVAQPGIILGANNDPAVDGKKKASTIEIITKKIKAIEIKDEAQKIFVKVDVVEVLKPDLDANIVAQKIAFLLEKRESFKLVQKRQIKASMAAGAKGIKTEVSGRLGGAEIARSEWYKEGTIPLHTIRNDVDYAVKEAHTQYGRLGVKVWISRGEFVKPGKGE
jgi:small subunit ribosomal protein S3